MNYSTLIIRAFYKHNNVYSLLGLSILKQENSEISKNPRSIIFEKVKYLLDMCYSQRSMG